MAESPDLRVLVVDDEVPLATIVASYLDREGFATELAHDGPSAVAAAHHQPPDLVVLDVMLPGFDGVEACRRIRGFSDCYIIMLTAKSDEIDKILGLSMGADDYLVKPFSPRELVARVRAMLRRPRTLGTGGSAAPNQPAFVIGDLTVDELARQASLEGRPIDLTRTEFDLLAALAGHPGRAFSRRQLIDQVWGDGWSPPPIPPSRKTNPTAAPTPSGDPSRPTRACLAADTSHPEQDQLNGGSVDLGSTKDLGQDLSTERICSWPSSVDGSARSSRLKPCRW